MFWKTDGIGQIHLTIVSLRLQYHTLRHMGGAAANLQPRACRQVCISNLQFGRISSSHAFTCLFVFCFGRSSVFTAQVQQDSTGTKMCLSTRVLACKKAGAPMLCWQARASLVVVLQTVVERIVADEDEIPIVEVRAMVKSLLSAVITRASTPDSQMLSFALGALSHLVQALAERPTELQDVISDGVRSMLEVVATLPVHGVLQMQVITQAVYPSLDSF